MFSQFRVERKCKNCRSTRRTDKWCCKRAKIPRTSAREQRELYALELRLPVSIPNSSLLEHIATSNFFHHYVSPERTFYRLEQSCLSAVIENAKSRRKLSEIIIALGILILPKRSSSSVSAARSRYTTALRFTNRALEDPASAKTDEALMAVILLGLYETTPDQSHSIDTWSAHLDGARMLLRLLGREGLSREPAYKMFSVLRVQIIMHCFMKMQPVPQDLIDLSEQISETQDNQEKTVARLMSLLARVCGLSAADRSSDTADPSFIITEAENLDNDLVEWSEQLPEAFTYIEEKAPDTTSSFKNFMNIYTSVFSCEVWTLYRLGRISLNGMIIKQCSILEQEQLRNQKEEIPGRRRLRSKDSHAFSKGGRHMAILTVMRGDICSSIPFLMELHSNPTRKPSDLPLHARTLVMHLLQLLMQTASPSDDLSVWAASLLAEIRNDSKIDHGAIWMNNTQTVQVTQNLAFRTT